ATDLLPNPPQVGGGPVGGHGARPYRGFTGGQSVTAWIPLSPSNPANGCMRALPVGQDSDPAAQPDTPEVAAQLVDVVLSPGEMSLHNADVLHGSSPNASGEERVGFAIRDGTPAAQPR